MNKSQKRLQLNAVIKKYFEDQKSSPSEFLSDLESEINELINYHEDQKDRLIIARDLLSTTDNSDYWNDLPYTSSHYADFLSKDWTVHD